MKAREHLELYQLEETYWWFIGRRELVAQMVGQYHRGPAPVILDAGCGTGTLAVELARRRATVVAIELSPTLVSLARERVREQAVLGTVEFRVGDMLDPALGAFDHVVAMDSLIHYPAPDMVRALVALAERTRLSMVVTFAPRTLPLAVMHQIGRAFPRRDRAPAIEPVAPSRLLALLAADPDLASWRIGRSARIAHGFYTSQGLELRRA